MNDTKVIQNNAANSIALLLERNTLISKMNAFSHIRVFSLSKLAKQDISMNENLRILINNMLSTVSNEPKFFEAMNLAINSVARCKNSEVLLLDKVHRTAYGYPSPYAILKSQRDQSPDTLFNKTLIWGVKEDELNIGGNKESAYNSMDMPSLLNEDYFSKKIEFTFEEESVLKYAIHSKEIINSSNLPQITLYNKMIDIPLIARNGQSTPGQFSKTRLPRFLYFPICGTNKEILGVIRIFLENDETLDPMINDKLSK